MPQDDHWLASFEVVPPQKLVFPQQKMKIPDSPWKTGFSRPLLEEKNRTPFLSFSAVFVGNSVTPSRTTSDPAQKTGKNQAKILRFSCFSGENFGTILSRRARLSRTSRAPSRLSLPRPINYDGGRDRQTKISRFLEEKSIIERSLFFASANI